MQYDSMVQINQKTYRLENGALVNLILYVLVIFMPTLYLMSVPPKV